MREKDLQKQCEYLLNLLHIPYIHITTFIRRRCSKCGTFLNFPVEKNKGVPDLVIFHKNGLYLVELKTEKGRLKNYQKEWIENLPDIYKTRFFVIRNVEELNNILMEE